ncbi:cytokinin riboside 5'-monophosphate phosphoribohydrolase LOG7 [Tanacetum coccineum]
MVALAFGEDQGGSSAPRPVGLFFLIASVGVDSMQGVVDDYRKLAGVKTISQEVYPQAELSEDPRLICVAYQVRNVFRKVGLLNVEGYYNSLVLSIDKAIDEGFISPTARKMIVSAPNAKQVPRDLQVSEHRS